MEECCGLGLVKSIGVSNFSCKKIDDMLTFSRILPAVNQVEMNPCWQQRKLIDLCKEKGIVVTSFSPLGAVNVVLKENAQLKGKSVPQVCLRWAYQEEVAIVVKSYKPERMVKNRSIFDWELSEEECEKIQSRAHRREKFVSENGPIKSIEELWDGEL